MVVHALFCWDGVLEGMKKTEHTVDDAGPHEDSMLIEQAVDYLVHKCYPNNTSDSRSKLIGES